MASLNEATLIGNLGQPPETRYLPDGKAVCNFSLATTEKWKDKNGDVSERVEWHRIVMFGRQAEIAEKYLQKGSAVFIRGRIQARKWTDNNGVDRYTTEIVADRMQMLGGKPLGQQQEKAPEAKSGYQTGGREGGFGDDIPFS